MVKSPSVRRIYAKLGQVNIMSAQTLNAV
jgi:hypothetical protein